MNQESIFEMSVTQLAEAMATKTLSPVELVDAYLERIDRYDVVLSSHVCVLADEARAAARRAERDLMDGVSRGPLHGIPFGVKDQLLTQGAPTTLGSKIVADDGTTGTATTISRLETAGAILLGKHNLHELGKGGTIDFPYGYPRNPWNLAVSSSSSSNGTGVAVAAGLNAFALGEDTGGSIRGPASSMNLVGLRPTFGRVSRHGGVMYGWMADTIGPITRTVRDCALVLGAIAGYDPADPLTSKRPVQEYLGELELGVDGLRIGVVRELTWIDGVHPAVRHALEDAVTVFREAGARVDDISLPSTRKTAALTSATTDVDVASFALRRWLREDYARLDVATRTRLAAAALVPGAVRTTAMRLRSIVRHEVLHALRHYDVLLSPANVAPPDWLEGHGPARDDAPADPAALIRKVKPSRHTARPFSIANTPAISIPAGFADANRPVAIQLAGRRFDEAMVLRVARAYERARPFHERVPDLDANIAAFQRAAVPQEAE